jgi:hypothetical protein
VWAFGGDKGDGIVCQEVESITLVDRGLGVLEGVGLGFLIGGGSGVFLGFVSGDDSEGWFAATAEEKAVGLGVFLGVLGGICGLIAGAAKGHVDIYELDDADSRFLNPTTPPLGGSRRVDRIGGNSRIEWTSSSDRLVVVIRF